jgi:hypothetical protein
VRTPIPCWPGVPADHGSEGFEIERGPFGLCGFPDQLRLPAWVQTQPNPKRVGQSLELVEAKSRTFVPVLIEQTIGKPVTGVTSTSTRPRAAKAAAAFRRWEWRRRDPVVSHPAIPV